VDDSSHSITQGERNSREISPPRRSGCQVAREPVVKLASKIQHHTNRVKLVAYQVESGLERAVALHYLPPPSV